SNIFRFGLVWYYGTILHDIPLMRTVAFVGLGIDALMYIYSVRSMRRHVWKTNPFSNSYLTLSLLVSWLLLFVAVYVPGLQTILHTVPLGAKEWLLLILFGFSNMLLIEMMKSLLFHRKNISPV
ncbi:MAG TPA: cation-translocating P-type ATPase C-terminal domain-containing protein, partial [Candidatus Kapabacteria bacterium]|nr:cation-translocating P-type ATPase C-terminal domain-containing protein [Candidatus Kapabacteria bacterium]